MRRVLVPLLSVIAIIVAGCSQAASAGDTSVVAVAPQGPTDAATYQAVILGPGDDPVAAADVAPRVFKEEPAIIDVTPKPAPRLPEPADPAADDGTADDARGDPR